MVESPTRNKYLKKFSIKNVCSAEVPSRSQKKLYGVPNAKFPGHLLYPVITSKNSSQHIESVISSFIPHDEISKSIKNQNHLKYFKKMITLPKSSKAYDFVDRSKEVSPTRTLKSFYVHEPKTPKFSCFETSKVSDSIKKRTGRKFRQQGDNESTIGNRMKQLIDQRPLQSIERSKPEAIDTTSLEEKLRAKVSDRINGFRHSMNKLDASQSGTINFNEFQKLMRKYDVDIVEPQTRRYFEQHAKRVHDNNVIGDIAHTNGAAVDIEGFVRHLVDSDKTGVSAANEENRLVAQLSADISIASDVMNSIPNRNPYHPRGKNRELSINEMKSFLQVAGRGLSGHDIELLISKMQSSPSGNFSILEVDRLVRDFHKRKHVNGKGKQLIFCIVVC